MSNEIENLYVVSFRTYWNNYDESVRVMGSDGNLTIKAKDPETAIANTRALLSGFCGDTVDITALSGASNFFPV